MKLSRTRLYQHFANYSFKRKLLLLIFICIVVPVFFSLSNIIFTTSDIIKKQSAESEEYSIDLAYSYLTQKIDEIIQVMNYVQFDSEVTQVLNEGMREEISPRSFLEINNNLEYLTRNSDISITLIPIVDSNIFTNRSFISEFDRQDLLEKGNTYLDPHSRFTVHWFSGEDFGGDKQNIVLGRKMVNYSGTTVAYMYAGVDEAGIDTVLSKNEIQSDRSFILLDANNDLLHSHNASVELSKIKEDIEQQDNTFFKEIESEEYLVVQKELHPSGWRLISYIPYSEVAKELKETYQFHIVVQVFFFSLLTLFILYAVGRYVRPINHLANIANDIHNGNLDIRSNIQRRDEIGKLSLAFDSMLDRVQEMVKQITMEQELKKKAEIETLHAKIKPHFIYNVLNTIRLQVMKNGDSESSRSISTFTKFLRNIYTVSEMIPFEQEIDHTSNYVKLVNKIRKNPVDLTIDVEETTLSEEVPSFFLQPIVENSIKHGKLKEDGKIHIYAKAENHQIFIHISDNGIGIDPDEMKDIREFLTLDKKSLLQKYNENQYGIGLKNIYQRMQILFHSDFEMMVENREQGGISVTFTFPLKEEKE